MFLKKIETEFCKFPNAVGKCNYFSELALSYRHAEQPLLIAYDMFVVGTSPPSLKVKNDTSYTWSGARRAQLPWDLRDCILKGG